jgi:hypothetical protein
MLREVKTSQATKTERAKMYLALEVQSGSR